MDEPTTRAPARERPAPAAAAAHEHASHARLRTMVDPGYWPRATGLRLVISVCYAALIPAGLLPMSIGWWLVSGGGLVAFAAAMFVHCICFPHSRWIHINVSPYVDVLMVTLAIVAVARPDYPIWIGYMLTISSLSATHSSRYVFFFSLWTIAAFWCSDAALTLSGRADTSWQLSTVVTIMAVFTALNADVIATSNRKLRDLVLEASLTDPLTGLANRRRFRQVLESHETPETRPLAVLMYDVDNFKQINEDRGHIHADGVLVQVAEELRDCFREADTIARYGGDELIVLAHVATLEEAAAMGERSLRRIRDRIGVTLSAGVSVYPLSAGTLEAAVRAADEALGRAKHGGKARVAFAA